ncbi:hypothetical protein ACIPSA_35115 [Streptomyces sp. NPDC086549]|uniref:hypothetical protein n=1 Tax=Streptomyces sp. NPDC086549 TaxID=3365752 RepID=UPI0037FF7EB5
MSAGAGERLLGGPVQGGERLGVVPGLVPGDVESHGQTVVAEEGFAYAATDKGNSGPELYKDGAKPGDAITEWHLRVTQLSVAARACLKS